MIIANDRYLMNETDTSLYAVTMTLTIKVLHKPDFGGYKCISKNSIGDADQTVRLYREYSEGGTQLKEERVSMFNLTFTEMDPQRTSKSRPYDDDDLNEVEVRFEFGNNLVEVFKILRFYFANF